MYLERGRVLASTRIGELEALLEFDFATAVDALDHHVRSAPDRLAIHYGETGERLSYGDFGERTDAIAGNLVALGVRRGEPVGVLSTDALAAACAMYGIWKAGAVYAPVNYLYRGDLLAYQLDDTKPKLLIVDDDLYDAYLEVEAQLESRPEICLVTEREDAEPRTYRQLLEPAARPDVVVEFDDPANIIYTSGTTGPSKGVLQSHRWVNGYTWIGRRSTAPDDVIYSDLPMYHVGGAHSNVARALWVGASLSLWDRFSPSGFWGRIKEDGCTMATLLDVMITWLYKAEPRADDRDNSLNKVLVLPTPSNHHEFSARFGIDFMMTGFGQSESGSAMQILVEECAEGEGTPSHLYRGLDHAAMRAAFEDCGMLVLDGEDERVVKGILGTPSHFFEVAVVDGRDRIRPDGEVGELVMRPALPALILTEYLAKPAATSKAFKNLWFHTGDAARRDEYGVFHFVDRLGDRIRVRGENVSGGQVEEQVARHPDVQLAAVIAAPSDDGDEDAIVAFVEMVEGREFDAEALHEHCRSVMPKFMRPREIIQVDEIPSTPTNKIEKYKLRKLFTEGQRS